MKCIIPEISWNNRDPVFSLDIQPKVDAFWRLATAGSDAHIVIWHLAVDENGSINIEAAADLNKHQKAVNVVRWSPNGELLAAGDDESNIILWKQRKDVLDVEPLGADATAMDDGGEYKETWSIYKILRGHMDDVYDISWSPDSKQLISGSVDNTAIVWNIVTKTKHILQPNHKGFVQGVAWDPLSQYLATLSSDRVCRVFDANSKKIISRSGKGTLPFPDTSPLHGQTLRLYHDDTLKSYFRRLEFSPDGKLLIAPAGCVQSEHCPKKIHLTYVYTRYSFKQPTLALPSPDQFTVAVRCCPIMFEMRADGPKCLIPLPYRMIIAVASQTAVTFYDTQQTEPFATVTNIHYTRITDITWSTDGRLVAVSSTDGFCSLITFKADELGVEYTPPQRQEPPVQQPLVTGDSSVDTTNTNNKETAFHYEDEVANDKWTKEPESSDAAVTIMDVDTTVTSTAVDTTSQDIKLILETTTPEAELTRCDALETTTTTMPTTNNVTPKPSQPRRVNFITLSSPKSKKKIL